MTDLEVLTVGRVSVDLYPEQTGVSLAEVASFHKSIGGSPTNVAVAASRLGRKAAVVTKVGDDGFGEYVRIGLQGFGVDTSYVSTDPDLRTPIVFCELNPPEEPPLLFYREPTGPDMRLTRDDLPYDVISEVPIFWVTGSRFAEETSRSTVMDALRHRNRKTHTILDLDYRPMFWDSPDEAGAHIAPALEHVSVAVGNRDECEIAVGPRDPQEAANRLLDMGVSLAIVKMGGDGVLVANEDGMTAVEPLRVPVVCGLGAGDAFGGSLCHGLLSGWDPVRIVEYANAAGAHVVGELSCSDAMPTQAQVEAMLT